MELQNKEFKVVSTTGTFALETPVKHCGNCGTEIDFGCPLSDEKRETCRMTGYFYHRPKPETRE